MPIHAAAGGGWFEINIRVRVKLGKEFLQPDHAQRKHPGLVAVVARTPVAFVKRACDGQLGDFLAIAKNAKFGFPAQYFAAADQ